jgi:hypothetical protein
MATLVISAICGPSRVFRADGEKLRRAIHAEWSRGEGAVVDFENARIASVSFLDEGIAVLALSVPLTELKKKLELRNISDDDRQLLNRLLTTRSQERAETQRDSDSPSGS